MHAVIVRTHQLFPHHLAHQLNLIPCQISRDHRLRAIIGDRFESIEQVYAFLLAMDDAEPLGPRPVRRLSWPRISVAKQNPREQTHWARKQLRTAGILLMSAIIGLAIFRSYI